ncbi:MAG TPA: arginine deiminase family protein [Gemmatimonadales bacterium]|jgi:dimethylargininase
MRFTRAIVRPPGATFAAGITSSNLGRPDLALALAQHEAYCAALEGLGLALTRLPADPAFPDSTFVEDAAIVTSEGAILTRPGAPSRAGEVTSLGAALTRWFPAMDAIASPGTVDGGDVCEAGTHFFIGRSERTNAEGAGQLAGWLAARGFESSVIDIREMPGLLHLKTGLSWLGGRQLLADREVIGDSAFTRWDMVQVPDGEAYAANCVRVNDAVLVARGFRATTRLIGRLGYEVVEVGMSEYQKMDGGLSCLSVRW